MEFTLTKSKTFNVQPYGKFALKWKIPRSGETPNMIAINELEIYNDEAMPLSDEQNKMIVDLMKKSKTEILSDGVYFYTRVALGFTRVWHKKLLLYKKDEAFKNAVDSGHSFGKKEKVLS